MESFKNVETEYNDIYNIVKNESVDINNIDKKFKSFHKNISELKNDINNVPEIADSKFDFLNQAFKNFTTNIQKNLNDFENIIESPLENFINSLLYATEKNINNFNETINSLNVEKETLMNKRDIYFNYLEMINKTDDSIQNDESILNVAMKENSEQLYKYEVNRMKEMIVESNTKYSKIYQEINSINMSLTLTIKDYLIKFSKNISNISESFNNFSKELIKKVDSIKINDKKDYLKGASQFTLSEEELNMPKEKNIEEKKDETTILDETTKNDDKKTDESKKLDILNETKNLFSFFRRKNTAMIQNPNKTVIEKEPEIIPQNPYIDKRITIQVTKRDNKPFIIDIIKKIIGEEELKIIEITDLFHILTQNINEKNEEKNFAYFFFKQIMKLNNNRVISFKNKNNFTHLANIMNNLFLNNQTNNYLFILMIEVSQKMKIKNDYMYKIIQRKNEFFSTKTLWIKLIDNDLLIHLNEYVVNILKKNEEKNNNNKNEDEKYKLFEKTGLNNKIVNYKKLSKSQKNELISYAKEKICIILSKFISSMCCFLVPEKIINEIIIYYGAQFKFEYDLKCFLKNKIIVHNTKIRNQIRYCSEKEEPLNKKIICISSVSKFVPRKDLRLLLKMNKKLYPNLRKSIIISLLSEENLSIDSHLLLWKEYLEIENIKKKFKYQDIKEVIYISIDKDEINEEIREEKNINVIDKDLLRTSIVQKDKKYFIILKSILVSFLFLFPKIGYCQGMHSVVSFLFQLLDFDEEETFYFLCGLELNTKYHEIFEDDFVTLKTSFQIFEKILNINRPEIYYKFMDCNLMTNSYMSPWLITLFTQYIELFDKNNVPKLVFLVIEKFIFEGWSAIFNLGFTMFEYCYDKIMILESEKLISYVMNILEKEGILKNENFDKLKPIYSKNAKYINEYFIEKLYEITKFEGNNQYLNETINVIGFSNL